MGEDTRIFLIQIWKLGLPEIWIILVMLHGAILWPLCCFQFFSVVQEMLQ